MFLHLSVGHSAHGGGGRAWRGACMAGGVHGRGHAWWGCAWQGACVAGGMHGGGVHGRGACLAGGVHGRGHVWQGVFVAGAHAAGYACPPGGYDEIWSMSGRYASHWNAFLLV